MLTELMSFAALSLTAAQLPGADTLEPVRSANASVRASHRYILSEDWNQALHFANAATEAGNARTHRAAGYTNKCVILYRMGDQEGAVEACTMAVEIKPDREVYQANLATVQQIQHLASND